MADWYKEFEKNSVPLGAYSYVASFDNLYATFYSCFFRLLDTGVTQRLFYYGHRFPKERWEWIGTQYSYVPERDLDGRIEYNGYPIDYGEFGNYPFLSHTKPAEYEEEDLMYDLAFDQFDPIYQFVIDARKIGFLKKRNSFSEWFDSIYFADDGTEFEEEELNLYYRLNEFLKKEMDYYKGNLCVLNDYSSDRNPLEIKIPNNAFVLKPRFPSHVITRKN